MSKRATIRTATIEECIDAIGRMPTSIRATARCEALVDACEVLINLLPGGYSWRRLNTKRCRDCNTNANAKERHENV